jgi:hypothetical protein
MRQVFQLFSDAVHNKWNCRDTFEHWQCHITRACSLIGYAPRGVAVRDTELSNRIKKARLIAGELWEMLREDAAHRLGLAEAYPQAMDKVWSPDFYRKCQLAERLFAILDDVTVQDAAANGAAANVNGTKGGPAGSGAPLTGQGRATHDQKLTPKVPDIEKVHFARIRGSTR